MAKISLVISIVVTLLTAGLGFMTKSKIDGLQSTLKGTKENLARTTTDLNTTKGNLKKSQDDLAASQKQVDEQKTEIGNLTTQRDEAKKKADEATAAVQSKETEVAGLKQQLADITAKMGGGTDPNKTLEEVAALKEQLNKSQTELAEAKQVQATLTQKAQQAEESATRVAEQLRHYELNIAKAGLTGRVVAVNPGWNFVVIDVGDKQGAAVNAPLIVTRNGQNIAKLRVTSVEPNNSIADVINGSLAKGQTVQPGDMVVFAGRQPQPAAAPQQSAQANSAQGGAPQAQ